MKLARHHKTAALIYLAALGAYAGASGSRLLRPSSDTHFSYQAEMFLHGRLDLGRPPPSQNDWAEVEYLQLKDGRTVAGAFQRSQPGRFRELDGKVELIQDTDIQSRSKKFYVSFPPFPAVLFVPFVALFGLQFNDVIFTVILAAFGPSLLFLVLRHLAARGDSARSERDDLVLTGMFAVGTVYFYTSVLGQVWYTALVVSTVLNGIYLLCALDVRSPVGAGAALGAMILTRGPHMGFWGLFFLYEAWRAKRLDVKLLVRIAIPVVIAVALGAAFNQARFGAPNEFGHRYLNVRWTDRIQRYGLINFAFLSRNLTCALTLTPKLIGKPPYIQVSWHGMSLLLTTPALVYLLWPRVRGHLHAALWLTVAPIALFSLLYQNDGWVQFGFRFSIDYLLALMMLLSVGGRPINRAFLALVAFGVAVNLFGAITFGRYWQFYHDGFFPISPGDL